MNKFSSFLRRAENTGTKVQILPADVIKIENNSSEYSIPPDSILGHMVYNTGGAVFDCRVRLYGSGELDITLRNLKWGADGRFLIGEDIWGGLFALAPDKTVIYFAPDSLEWENMNLTYDGLFGWLCEGDTDKFYEPFIWAGWEKDIAGIGLNQGMAFYPFLWADCESMEARQRKIVPIDEMIGINFDLLSQIEKNGDMKEG